MVFPSARRVAGVLVLAAEVHAGTARPRRPLDERVEEARRSAEAARELAIRTPLVVWTLGEDALAARIDGGAGEGADRGRDVAGPRDPMRDDATARGCLLGMLAPSACAIELPVASPEGGAGAPDRAMRKPSSALASLAAGLYLPEEKALVLREDDAGGADGGILLHEVVHALQDAHFGLGPMLREDARGADALAARHAFVEGDASFAVLRDANLLEPMDDAFVEAFCRGFAGPAAGAADDDVVTPYVHGTRFVWSLFKRGGWRAVNAAWRSPPETTEQLLHIEKYRRREKPLPLPSRVRPLAGFRRLGRAAFGELDLRRWLALHLDASDAERFAADWGNGVSELVGRGDERAIHLRVRWDPHVHGKRAQDVARALEAALGSSCVVRPSLGPIAIALDGRDLVVLAGPRDAQGCGELLGWARDLGLRTPPPEAPQRPGERGRASRPGSFERGLNGAPREAR